MDLKSLIETHKLSDEFIIDAIQEKIKNDAANKQDPSISIIGQGQGFMVSQTLFAAEGLRLNKHLTDGPKNAKQLAEATGVYEPALYRMLRALSSIDILEHLEDDTFAQTSQLMSLNILDGVAFNQPSYQAWKHFMHTLKTGEASWSKEHGKSFYQYLQWSSPEEKDLFKSWNTRTSKEWLHPLVDLYQFNQYKKIIDVGGGEGSLLAHILQQNENVQGVLFDQSNVVSEANTMFSEVGVDDRVEIIGGDFFQTIPSGGDLYIISRVLLNWNDEECLLILENCRAAMGENGTLLVIDFLIPKPEHPTYQTIVFNDLNLLMAFGGGNRTEDEWQKLIEQGGFTLNKVIPACYPSLLSFIRAVPDNTK